MKFSAFKFTLHRNIFVYFKTQIGRAIVYLPSSENFENISEQLEREMRAEGFAAIELSTLPANNAQIKEQGLLYALPAAKKN